MKLKVLNTIEEMIEQIEIIRHLYPDMSLKNYQALLENMIPQNYKQLAVIENENCLGLTGFWTNTKLWSGKYIEIDNFIVHPNHRKKGIAKLMTDFIENHAKNNNCNRIVLDAFVNNYQAHRFYYKEGYEPLGFHFVKKI